MMLTPVAHHAERRATLRKHVHGPVLLLGNQEAARTLPMSPYPFRQDSNFLYLTGCSIPGAAVLLDDGGETLFLPTPSDDDPLWHGPGPTPAEVGSSLGFSRVLPREELAQYVPKEARTLAVSSPLTNAELVVITGRPHQFGQDHGDRDLLDALITMRKTKTPWEVEQMREAARITAVAHTAVMRAARPGTTEQALTALFEGILARYGATTGYGTILTVRGEVLHNHHHGHTLEDGHLLLLDGGGEIGSGYTVDITRTTPVSGAFTVRQRAAYDAVLAAQRASIAACTAGTSYREVHDTSSRILAQFLLDERLASGSVDELVDIGAHALFFPHGVGHHLGLDVHDLEAYGDLPAYPKGVGRPKQFGTENLRLNLPLEAGWIVTIEPGFYVVPAILNDSKLQSRFKHVVDFERASEWVGFGGIRLEDDILVTDGAPENLTEAVPIDPDEVEALVNTGLSAEDRLC